MLIVNENIASLFGTVGNIVLLYDRMCVIFGLMFKVWWGMQSELDHKPRVWLFCLKNKQKNKEKKQWIRVMMLLELSGILHDHLHDNSHSKV